MKRLYLDIAAYSDKPIDKHGDYVSAESEHSNILLLGYAFDDEDPRVINLMEDGAIPTHLVYALVSPDVDKFAYNARTVRVFLSRHLIHKADAFLPAYSWRCLKAWSEYLGYPKTLRGVTDILDIHDPCPNIRKTASQAITRILDDAVDPKAAAVREAISPKLNVLAQCVKQSVQITQEIHRRLRETPMTEREWTHYWVVEYANDRGIRLDTKFLRGALRCAAACKAQLWEQFRTITGLPAECGARAFKDWLSAHGVNAPSVSQETILKLRRRATGKVSEALDIWSAIMRNPTRHYQALASHCSVDGRLRGLYTCNGGKLGMLKFPFLQTDNLPACVDDNADELRKRVATCDSGWLKENLRSIPDILNRLLGTVFISGKGRRFAMFTFRHLNESVLHWLAQASFSDCAGKDGFPSKVPLVAEYLPAQDYANAGSAICRLYLNVENAIRNCLAARCDVETCRLRFHADEKWLTVTLPSGHALVYHTPFIRIDPAGFSAIRVMGLNPDNKWGYRILDGKNIVQDIVRAVARDFLLYKMVCVEANEDFIALPFRDGLLIEIDAAQNLCMAAHTLRGLPQWANGLTVHIDGYLCEDYFKRASCGRFRTKGGISYAR